MCPKRLEAHALIAAHRRPCRGPCAFGGCGVRMAVRRQRGHGQGGRVHADKRRHAATNRSVDDRECTRHSAGDTSTRPFACVHCRRCRWCGGRMLFVRA